MDRFPECLPFREVSVKYFMLTVFIFFQAVFSIAQFRESSSEVSLFAGIHSGDTFMISRHTYEYDDVEIEDATIAGLRWAYFFMDDVSLEMIFAGVNTHTTVSEEDFDIYYVHANALWQFGRGQFNPFVTAGLGAASMRYPRTEPLGWGQQTETRFSGNVGTGFKLYLSDRYGMRGDVRYWWTETGFEDYYYYYTYGNNLSSIELSLSLFFRF